jgi:hypothetical protein
MATFGKIMAAAVIALSASPTATQVQAADVGAGCRAQVQALWPQSVREVQRLKENLFNACVNNGGRVPG